ncbi:MAG TPA: hypothetical protein VHX37_02210 [Acidobacteriaceae bacterium]|jgi:hypothetical protein|nr:hypothetical protein [Acidobacteriaceae bacterium]
MKLLLSALLLAVVPAAFAQGQSKPSGPDLMSGPRVMIGPDVVPAQARCPLTLTSARLDWPGSYMPVTSADRVMEPSLALGFQNSSGKAVRSVAVTAELRVKKDVYALDATPVDVRLNFAGSRDLNHDLNKDLDQLATIPLPKGLHEYGLVQVRLDQVIFADGSLWKAAAKVNACEVSSFGMIATR